MVTGFPFEQFTFTDVTGLAKQIIVKIHSEWINAVGLFNSNCKLFL